MGRKIRDTLLFLAAVAGCVLLTLALAGKNNILSPAMIYNFSFLGIMVILYLVGLFGGLFRVTNVSSWLKESSEEIEVLDEEASLTQKIDAIDTFKPFRKNLDGFLQDISKSQSGICDIEDYVNEDEVDSYVHKRTLDLLPDILTSLGILGTFVGLVWGLRSFQPSTYETMTSSVTSLVDGIKVAFMTSIYGLLLSILFSSSLRNGYQAMTIMLNRFLDRFHSHVVPSAEMEAQNLLVNSQKEQNELMRSLTREFSDQVAHGFAANMAPTLEKINTQLGTMMTSISNNQQMFLQDIVNSFVKEMKTTFSTEFSQFGDSLRTLDEMTRKNMVYSQQTSQQLAEQMKAAFDQDERSMHTAIAEISVMQGKMQESVARMTDQNRHIVENYAKVQEETLKNLEKSEKESASFWVACNQTMQNYVKEASDVYEQFKKSAEESDKALKAIAFVYQKNEKILEDYQKRQKELQKTQTAMNESLEKIRDVFSQIEVAGNDGRQIILYPGLASRVSQESEQRIVKKMETMIEESEERQEEILDEIREDVKILNDRTARKGKWFS